MRTSSPLWLLACLVVFLPSCVTRALWEGKLRSTQVTGESWTAPVQDGTLLVDVENGQLWATLLPEGRPPVCCRMRPVAGYEPALRAAFPGDAAAEPSCELEITRELHEVRGENPRGLLTVQPGGTLLAVEVQVVDGSEATAGCRRYPMPAVIWNEVHHRQTGADVLGITWRVAATPFTVVTDAVLWAPVVVVNAVTWPFVFLYNCFTTPPPKS